MDPVKKSEVLQRTKPTILLLDINNILWRTAAVAVKNYHKEMTFLRQKKIDNKITISEEREYKNLYNEFIKIWKNIVFSMIRNIVKTHKPNSVIICRDAGYTWRHSFFPYYKGERRLNRIKSDYDAPYSPEEFYAEIDVVLKGLNNILCYHDLQCPMMEADDIIGVLSQVLCSHYNIIISSTDKDFADLITLDGSVKFFEHHRKEFLKKSDKNTFDEMLLLGDASDGIPRLHDSDDSIVMFRDYTDEEMKLTEDERDSIKRELVKSPSEMRPRFGVGAARKILAKLEEDGMTLEEYAKDKGIEDRYIRNKLLFSLRLDDLKEGCPEVISIVKSQFLKLKEQKQSFTQMQKFFAKNRLIEQLEHIQDFILHKFESKN